MHHKRMSEAKGFSPCQLLTRSMKYFRLGFIISLEKRKMATAEQGRFALIDSINMDFYGKTGILSNTTGVLGCFFSLVY